jgi:hypothetical protein
MGRPENASSRCSNVSGRSRSWSRGLVPVKATRISAARRHASGTERSARSDPHIPPYMLAAMTEESIAQELMMKSLVDDAPEYRQISQELERKAEAERARSRVTGFHRLKKSPEASDPESPVVQKVRHIHRQRKNELGRPRKGGGRSRGCATTAARRPFDPGSITMAVITRTLTNTYRRTNSETERR